MQGQGRRIEGTDDRKSTSPHTSWDAEWADDHSRAAWLVPDLWVTGVVPLLRERGVEDTLDVGCGVGRHALFLAKQGFRSHGIDSSLMTFDNRDR